MEALRRHMSDSCVSTTILAPARNFLGIRTYYSVEDSRNKLSAFIDARSTRKDGNRPTDAL